MPARERATGGRLRLFLAAFGDPGHLFPVLALGRELVGRGHQVHLQTWRRWQGEVEREGMVFHPAPEFPDLRGGPLAAGFYAAAERATPQTVDQLERSGAEIVVTDILTVAPALAAELRGLPYATLVPHPFPLPASGHPPFSLGARLPETALGRLVWRSLAPAVRKGLIAGREDLNRIRHRLGLPPRSSLDGALSRELVLVGTFPQLEYPRPWPGHVKVVGPLIWEPPAKPVCDPPGEGPLVLVAPSTSQDPDHRLLCAALKGLAGLPIRVLATWNGRPPKQPLPDPANAVVVPWLSYRETMARAQLVVCHGGHGTVARALSLGRPVVVCPVAGDMFENGARVAFAGVGARLPRRLIAARPLRDLVASGLADRRLFSRAAALKEWYARSNPPAQAAYLVEALAGKGRVA